MKEVRYLYMLMPIVLIFLTNFSLSYTFTDPVFNLTLQSDRNAYACYPSCVAYINLTSNNETLNGTYNITLSNTVSFNPDKINFSVYEWNGSVWVQRGINNFILLNHELINGTTYPFKVIVTLAEPLFGKWNLTLTMNISGILYNFTLDPYIDSINLTSPSNGTATNKQKPTFKFIYYSAYNSTLNCTLFINDTYKLGTKLAHNGTEENITANQSMAEGSNKWKIGCDVGNGGYEYSETRIIINDYTKPIIALPFYVNATIKKSTSMLVLNISVSDTLTTPQACLVRIEGQASNQTISYASGWCNAT
ncbi:MAG: hypothetical protein DRP03_03795, partial [Candidatus Aenigmatarchaeota archaeon]